MAGGAETPHIAAPPAIARLAALIWMAEKLKSEDRGRARELWAEKGKAAFAEGQPLT